MRVSELCLDEEPNSPDLCSKKCMKVRKEKLYFDAGPMNTHLPYSKQFLLQAKRHRTASECRFSGRLSLLYQTKGARSVDEKQRKRYLT